MRRASSNPLLAHLMTLSAFLCYCLESEVRVNKAGNQQTEHSSIRISQCGWITLNAKQDFSVAVLLSSRNKTLQPVEMSEYLNKKAVSHSSIISGNSLLILLCLVAHHNSCAVSKFSIISFMKGHQYSVVYNILCWLPSVSTTSIHAVTQGNSLSLGKQSFHCA